jgi:hypothetical protein
LQRADGSGNLCDRQGAVNKVGSAAYKLLITFGCAIVVAGGVACNPAPAKNALCVGRESGCYSTLKAAIAAAHAGNTIRIGPGTFAGGVTVNVSVTIIGAGARSTIIRGGNSVLTIGTYEAPSEPTVSIAGVTITGGVTRSSPEAFPNHGVPGYSGVIAQGGGIEIPESSAGKGATVTITNSVITGNRVAPTRALPIGPPCPGNVNCPYAEADGGGIDTWGQLTLAHSTVSDNLVGSASGLSTPVSDAAGGGIMVEPTGTLVVTDSVISNNHASATAPNGNYAKAGGIWVEGATLTMNHDLVTNNSAELSTAFPSSVGTIAQAGGVGLGGVSCTVSSQCPSATIINSAITNNSVSATNIVGDATASSGGLSSDWPLALLSNDTISGNSVTATTTPGSSGNAGADSGGGSFGASPIRDTRVTGNSVAATSWAGTAQAVGGAFSLGTDPLTIISNSVISDNRLDATTTSGSAIVEGGGIQNSRLLTLQNTVVENNIGTAQGPAGMAQGGGIWNGLTPYSAPPIRLTVAGSTVSGNTLTASRGITARGGGLYTTFPVTLTNNTTASNTPDQCFGC